MAATSSSSAVPEKSRRSPLPWVAVVFGLALVVALVLTAFRRRDPEQAQQIHADFTLILGALERYQADHGGQLPEEGSLDEMLVPRYLNAVPRDPWGRPYQYASSSQGVFLSSFGRENQRGGAGDNQDHTNHDGHQQLLR
ncbi:general secretion pathway protein GspG [Corallococcus sp. AB011P]|uniref:type II secretion system protein GspG n=1 Tax=unclassified Corallococcus TaxID=2685029 RepID=UPI000EA274E3|nr:MULTISPECIES: type II secretion system protein GspG [unclassified Corallococcus]RKG57060.1 general secretion pathway protein GspG [Corallococcus sp. AB011P]RKH86154.1 general secretion pathway protein GspG [Corallococcus sp. AB045]